MTLSWLRQQQLQSYEGEHKEGYSLTYISDLHCLLLFGGSVNRSAQVFLYDIVNKKWSIQKTSAIQKPSPRKNHTAYYQQSMKILIVYGGQAQKVRSLDTFDILFIDDWKWSQLSVKNYPTDRSLHTFTPIPLGNFLIFGGIRLPYRTIFQDLWILKGIDKMRIIKAHEIPGCTCQLITCNGNIPSGRYNHCAYYYQGYYYVIGGQTQIPQNAFTMYILDLNKLYWYRYQFNINLSQLSGFSILTNPLNISQIYIFGGYQKLENRINNHLYAIELKANQSIIRKLQKLPNIEVMVFNNCCQLPFQEVCGMCCGFVNGQLINYKVEIRNEQEQLGLQQFLKYIKNQQLLSQQLIIKVSNLQILFRQIQTYTSLLLKQYQESSQYDENIEQEKKNQIENCKQLISRYTQIQQIYNENLEDLKKARRQLSQINQHFQGYIDTERDQDQ